MVTICRACSNKPWSPRSGYVSLPITVKKANLPRGRDAKPRTFQRRWEAAGLLLSCVPFVVRGRL